MGILKERFTDYFDLLGVDQNATKDEVQKAFMLKATVWHPDKACNDEDREHYTKVYQDLQVAYKILSNDHSRKQYADAQQTTDMEFKFANREVGYDTTTQFRKDDGTFDMVAFQQTFDQSRDQKEQSALDALNHGINDKVKVNDKDLSLFMARREAETDNIVTETFQVFSGTGNDFDSGTFNRAFDMLKEQSPMGGMQLYEGDPMSMFSNGGLEECDQMSGINLNNGLEFATGRNIDNLIVGQSINPNKPIDLKALQTDETYGQERKLTNKEIEDKLSSIQSDRNILATMDSSEFIVEPSEIELLYSDLFAPSNIEGLAPAPVQEPSKIRKKIEQKQKLVEPI